MAGPDEEDKEVEEFKSDEEEVVEEFETVEEGEGPDVVEEFEGFDENASDDIESSGFKTKGGEIPDYEPTVDEVLSYAMGRTRDPSGPSSPKARKPVAEGEEASEGEASGVDDSLDELLDEVEEAFEEEGPAEEPDEEEERE